MRIGRDGVLLRAVSLGMSSDVMKKVVRRLGGARSPFSVELLNRSASASQSHSVTLSAQGIVRNVPQCIFHLFPAVHLA